MEQNGIVYLFCGCSMNYSCKRFWDSVQRSPLLYYYGIEETSSGDEMELLHRRGSWGQIMGTSVI